MVQDHIHLLNILDCLNDMVMVVDPEYRIIIANKRLSEMVGERREDIIGKRCFEVSHNRKNACIKNCPLKSVFENGSEKTISHTHTFWDGTRKYEEVSFRPIKDQNNNVVHVLEIIKDLTENKKIETQLIHSEKLACMGEIAASLSHEINNPLSIITGFVQRVLSKLNKGDEIVEEMKIIEQECLRCSRILRDLLNFAGPGELQKNICDINDIVRAAIPLLDYKLKAHHIDVIEDLSPTPIYVKLDLHQFQQVLINILLNAIQSMPGGGKLHIKLNHPANQRIELIIRDEGSGIAANDIHRIFDPFFSTKAEEGTGLGLSLSKRIIEAHGGDIHAESEFGKGTSMIIHLPLKEG